MAKPTCDQYTRFSNELLEAVIESDFSKRQLKILLLIWRVSYGCGKQDGIFRVGDFTFIGLHKNVIKPELTSLYRARVIYINEIPYGDRRETYYNIRLNKDYDQWRISIKGNVDGVKEVVKRNLNKELAEQYEVKNDPADQLPFVERHPKLAAKLNPYELAIIQQYEMLIDTKPFDEGDLPALRRVLATCYPAQIKSAITAFFKNRCDAFSSEGFKYIVEPLLKGMFGTKKQGGRKKSGQATPKEDDHGRGW